MLNFHILDFFVGRGWDRIDVQVVANQRRFPASFGFGSSEGVLVFRPVGRGRSNELFIALT